MQHLLTTFARTFAADSLQKAAKAANRISTLGCRSIESPGRRRPPLRRTPIQTVDGMS
jgi:hypothetical protein